MTPKTAPLHRSRGHKRPFIAGPLAVTGHCSNHRDDLVNCHFEKLPLTSKYFNFMKKLFYLFLIIPSLVYSQNSKRDSIWLPLKPFIGTWRGDGGGEPGNGKYERTYQFIFNNNFIEIHNKSTYPPSTAYPKGETHEDLGFISFDKNRKTFMLRQFHIEGFVNVYALDSISPDRKTIIFRTEQIENIPNGWQAKESYRILKENEIEETFELAEPGKKFEVYSKVKLVRQK